MQAFYTHLPLHGILVVNKIGPEKLMLEWLLGKLFHVHVAVPSPNFTELQ